METATNKEKLNELRNLKNRVLEEISCNTDPKFSKMVSLINENVSAILDESIKDGDIPNNLLDAMIETLKQWEKEIDKYSPQKCWCCSIDNENDTLYLKIHQTKIKKIEEFQGEKMYYTSFGSLPETHIAFTEIDACKKALSRFHQMQKDAMCLIEQAEAKIKELEQQKTEFENIELRNQNRNTNK
jgi:hypothetical protein